jgi:hypothetical protein
MQLEKIISVSGKSGLFKIITQVKNGFIIEDITTKKKMSISNSSQVSLLDNVAMFTFEKEVSLFDIFENIAKDCDYKECISHKSSDVELKNFMDKALPNYDTNRVYVSDIKKLAQWYNILHQSEYITPESFAKDESEETSETAKEAKKEEKTEKKTAAKKPALKTEKAKTPKVKESSRTAKSAPKSTHRKQG